MLRSEVEVAGPWPSNLTAITSTPPVQQGRGRSSGRTVKVLGGGSCRAIPSPAFKQTTQKMQSEHLHVIHLYLCGHKLG